MKKAHLRSEGMIPAIRSCLTALRTVDQNLFLRIKKVNQHWDLIIAAVKCWDAKTMVFRFGKDEMCPTLEEVHRIFEIPRNVLFVPRETANLACGR